MTIQKRIEYFIFNTEGILCGKEHLKLKISNLSGNYLIHRNFLRHRFLKKQNSASTKTKSEVRGGGRKPWKQKGTGRARAGSIRSPLWRGGGVIFGPKPKKVSFKLNKKERKLSLFTLLYNKTKSIHLITEIPNELILGKTKNLIKFINVFNLSLNKKILIIVDKKNDYLLRSTRNIKNIELISINHLNLSSLIKANHIILTLPAFNLFKKTNCDE
jgi:large subunit ribosomal protein L4